MFKLSVLYYFLFFRFHRYFFSNRISFIIKQSWRRNLKKSKFYAAFSPFRLDDFPVIQKNEFMANFNAMNTVGIKLEEALNVALQGEADRSFRSEIGDISVGLSTGTSGNRGLFLTSTKERAMWMGAILDRVIGLSLKRRKVAFFLRANNKLYESSKSASLEFQFFDIKRPFEDLYEELVAYDADILIGQPSLLMKVAHISMQRKYHWSFQKIISVAEVLEKDQEDYLSQVFGVNIHQVYQCTEGFLAYTCRDGNLHFNEDFLTIEKKYLNKEQTKFSPIITDYLRKSQPVIRYLLDDIIHIGKACSCGSKATVIKKIEGRQDDIYNFTVGGKEVTIFPDFIRRAIANSSDLIINYQLNRVGESAFELGVKTSNSKTVKNAYNKVQKALKDLFIQYGIDAVEFIQCPIKHDFTKKFKRINNDYSKQV